MSILRRLAAVAAPLIAAAAPAQTLLKDSPIHGIFESQFFSTRADRGVNHKLSWGEFYGRPTKDLKLTYSFGVFPGGHITDEAVAEYTKDAWVIRAGRMRTSFGFNDWASLFYNGFNSIPLVRLSPLSDGIALTRQDSGLEVTTSLGDVQVEVAAFDSSLERDQITPTGVDTGIVRLQIPRGPFIVGVDALKRLRHDGGIYGFDVRYTAPRLVGRMEYFNGDGPGSGQGAYADVQYRVPKMPRTQLVGRTEYLKPGGGGDLMVRHTVGVRQIFCNYFQLNVNYSWGKSLLGAPAFPAPATDNFSARALFQVRF